MIKMSFRMSIPGFQPSYQNSTVEPSVTVVSSETDDKNIQEHLQEQTFNNLIISIPESNTQVIPVCSTGINASSELSSDEINPKTVQLLSPRLGLTSRIVSKP